MTSEMANKPRGIKRFIFKEIVEGDRLKFEAISNLDATAGGGARDLRFSPYNEFKSVFERMLPTKNSKGVSVGRFNWKEGDHNVSKEAYFHPPTTARPFEGRIASIDKYLPGNKLPALGQGIVILLIIQRDDDSVWISFTTDLSLQNDPWRPEVRHTILGCLRATRRQGVSTAGFVDFEMGVSFCNGK